MSTRPVAQREPRGRGAASQAASRGVSGGNPPRRGRSGRAGRSAAQVFAVLVLGLLLAALLSVESLSERAEALPYGTARNIALSLVRPLERVSGALLLDRPGRLVDGMLNRTQDASAADVEPMAGLGGDAEPHPVSALAQMLGLTTTTLPVSPGGTGDATDSGDGRGSAVHGAGDATTPGSEGRTLSAAQPLVIWVCGDSLVEQVGLSFINYAGSHDWLKSSMSYKISSGLSRPDFHNWPKLMQEKVAELDPGLTVAMFGGNDAQGLLRDGKALKAFSDAWNEEYGRRVGEAMDILGSRGGHVVWLGGPIKRSPQLASETEKLNGIYRAEAETRAHVTFIDCWKLFSDENGAYASYLVDQNGKRRMVREPDGEHFTMAGGDRVAAVILQEIRRIWKVRP